jgi:hypothetical protein
VRRSVVILAAAAAALAAPAARAQNAEAAAADSRCLVAMVALSSNARSAQALVIAKFGVAYYAGRVRTEDPTFDLAKDLKRISAELTPPMLQAEAARCGPPVLQMLQQISAAFPPRPPASAPQARPRTAPSRRVAPPALASSTDNTAV